MIPKCSQLSVGIAALQIAMFSACAAEAQLYPDRPPVDAYRRVITWGNRRTVLPEVVVERDWLLTSWGPSMVETPGIALVQLSTGKSLWTVIAEPEDSLTGWLIDDRVHVSRHTNRGEFVEHQIRDPATGVVQHTASIPFGPKTTVMQFLNTVFIAGHKEVFDRQTGERRGALPADVNGNQLFCEIAGRLYAWSLPDAQKQADLLEVDLPSLEITRRLNLDEHLTDRRIRWPILSNQRWLILTAHSEPMSSRPLTAIDLETQQLAWQIEVAPHAPLLFVTDLSSPVDDNSLPSDLHERPLLIDWATGEHRLGDLPNRRADLVRWIARDPVVVAAVRTVDEMTILHLRRETTEQLVGFDIRGRPAWHHELTLLPPRPGNPQHESSLRIADRYAVLPGAQVIDVVDLRTGEIVHQLRPETVGLVRRTVVVDDTDATGSTAAVSGSTPAARPRFGDRTTIVLIVAALLGGYLVIRRLAGSPRS